MPTDASNKIIFKIGPFIAVVGILLSAYLTYHHYAIRLDPDRKSFCNVSEEINCDVVALHPSSKVLGIPLGVYGMGYFAVMAFLCLRVSKKHPEFALAYIRFSSLIGLIVTAMLFYQSKVRIGAICIMCIAVYVTNLALLLSSNPFSWNALRADIARVYRDLQVRN